MWVTLEGNDFTDSHDHTRKIPFDKGSIIYTDSGKLLEYPNYLLGVALTEIGPTTDMTLVHNHLITAHTVLARLVTYENCPNHEVKDETGNYAGMSSYTKQKYDPKKYASFTPEQIARYQAAVDNTATLTLTYQQQWFDPQYRAKGSLWTRGNIPPHLKILDPAGEDHQITPQTGFMQTNANHYAWGEAHNRFLPPLHACNLIVHFLTAVDFDCFIPTPTTHEGHRFTVVAIDNLDTRESNPLLWKRGTFQTIRLVLQNTGTKRWHLTPPSNGTHCTPDDYNNRTISIVGHWYSYQDNTPIDFEGNRIFLCQEWVNGNLRTHVNPGENYPHQTEGQAINYLTAAIWVPETLSPGRHWLRLDIELRNPHPTIWVSGLDPNTNPNQPHWPTQNILIQIQAAPFNIPPEPIIATQSHPANIWLNQNQVNLTWQNGGQTVDHYTYAWQHQRSFEGWQTTQTNTLTTTRPDGHHTLYLQAIGPQGQASNVITVGPLLIDTQPPTLTLIPPPTLITNPLTTNFTLNWTGNDEGQSGLFFDIHYATAPYGSEPPPTPLKSHILYTNTTTTTLTLSDLGLTLHPNTQYYIWVRARDGANNITPWQLSRVHYQPVPLIATHPTRITHHHLYSHTTPLTNHLTITNHGGQILTWTVTTSATWLNLSPTHGVATSTLLITLTPPLTLGTYQTNLHFNGPPNTYNNPYTLPIILHNVAYIQRLYLPILLKK